MEELLTQVGLTEAQAKAYLFLLEHGPATPPAVAAGCGITRSNAYKVLESLDDLDLVIQKEVHKKYVFEPVDPTALASLVAAQHNKLQAIENNVKVAMTELRSKFRTSTSQSSVMQGHGRPAIIEAFAQQAAKSRPIYFFKSRADIPFMGFDAMSKVRHLAADNDSHRYAITPDAPEISKDPTGDTKTRLTRTLIPLEAYTSPVEWSASDDELLIVKYDGEGTYIKITDTDIADAFRQIFSLMQHAINNDPKQPTLPDDRREAC